jgi:hypothetical protein
MNTMQWMALDDGPALERLLGQWRQNHPGCGVLALLPEAERERLGVLQAACRDAGPALAGGIFPALIRDGRFSPEGVWLIRLDHGLHFRLVSGLDGTDAPSRLIDALSTLIPESPPSEATPTLCLLFDAMLGHIGSLMDQLYLNFADRVRYTGANAGSESFAPMHCLFDERRCIGNGALCVLLAPSVEARLDHGYPIPSETMLASSTEGNCITSIDWQPAYAVYRQLIAEHYGVSVTHDNFYSLACHFPFGVMQADGSVIVRIPVAIRDDDALYCVGEVPANRLLVVLRAPDPVDNDCIARLSAHCAASGKDTLLFYCAGRRLHMGEGALDELATLARSGCNPLGGALSLGEIGNIQADGYPMFHNAALVSLAVSET